MFTRLILLRLVVFLAAFLLFQIELIVSKAMLPGFGGSYLVWSVCVMFFQGALLIGYAYSHLVSRYLTARRYLTLHIVLLFLPMLFFPISLLAISSPSYKLPFVIEILWLLAASVGFAFLLLSTVSVITQSGLAATGLPGNDNPYFLYGTSNLGSLLGLLTYPFLVEPFIDMDTQLAIWQGGYVLLAVLGAAVLVHLIRNVSHELKHETSEDTAPAGPREIAVWLLFSAAASAMFLAVTNVITFDLASIPLLWMLPLCIYLLSFVLNFKKKPWCPAWLKDRFSVTVPVAIILFLLSSQGLVMSVPALVLANLAILFVFCMYCQNEVILHKPESTRNLTTFYMTIAFGGFAGSALVSWVIPLISSLMIEYLAGFLLAAIAAMLAGKRRERKWWAFAMALAIGLVALSWPLTMSLWGEGHSRIISGLHGIALVMLYFGLRDRYEALALALALFMGLLLFHDRFTMDRTLVYKHRNYYGIYNVYDKEGKRWLRHGATMHGSESLNPAKAGEPEMYYHRTAPAGELLTSGLFDFKKVAIIGLGTGSLAAFSPPDRTIDFYELDPDNLEVAEKYFSYLAKSKGPVNFIFGDARLSLFRSPGKTYNLIVIDAFNSDSIPVHLITTQAVQEYQRHLQPGGFLLFHVSNRYLNLTPVLAANARVLNLHALYKSNRAYIHPDAELAEWVVLTNSQETADLLVKKLGWTDLARKPLFGTAKPWTDRFSNILSALIAKP